MIGAYQLTQISLVTTVTVTLATLIFVLHKFDIFHGLLSCLSAEIIRNYRSSSFIHFLMSILGGMNHGVLISIAFSCASISRNSHPSHHNCVLKGKRKCPKNMPELSTVEHVSKNVWRVLGMNPGAHTLQGREFLIESVFTKSRISL